MVPCPAFLFIHLPRTFSLPSKVMLTWVSASRAPLLYALSNCVCRYSSNQPLSGSRRRRVAFDLLRNDSNRHLSLGHRGQGTMDHDHHGERFSPSLLLTVL